MSTSDERKCPRCGSERTRFGTTYGDDEPEREEWGFESQWCGKLKCGLPCRLWDEWQGLQRERQNALDALELAQDAISDAIRCADESAREARGDIEQLKVKLTDFLGEFARSSRWRQIGGQADDLLREEILGPPAAKEESDA